MSERRSIVSKKETKTVTISLIQSTALIQYLSEQISNFVQESTRKIDSFLAI